MTYDPHADAASVEISGAVGPDDVVDSTRLDEDRCVRFGATGQAIEYEFLNVRRYGVRLDDLEHRAELATLFAAAGFQERDWGHPIPTRVLRRRNPAAS